jgi:hypothetical protein
MNNLPPTQRLPFRRGHLPYRGEVWLHYPKPRKQKRDLKGEKHQYIISFAITILASILSLGIGIMNFAKDHDDIALCIFILLTIILITIAISQINAARSINKFRPGYDLDISDWPKEMKDFYSKVQPQDQQPGEEGQPGE